MYSKHNDPIITNRFHCKRNFALWKFRQCKFSPWRNFASANFRSDEISLQWMRNFAKMTGKFLLAQREFASALTKFRRTFARTKNEKHRILFAFLLHSTVVWAFIVTKSEQLFQCCVLFTFLLLFSLLQHDLHQILMLLSRLLLLLTLSLQSPLLLLHVFHFSLQHEVVLFSQICYSVTSTSSTSCSWCCFILYLIFPLPFLCPAKVLQSSQFLISAALVPFSFFLSFCAVSSSNHSFFFCHLLKCFFNVTQICIYSICFFFISHLYSKFATQKRIQLFQSKGTVVTLFDIMQNFIIKLRSP